jgi:hypothetical protein
MGLFSKKEQKYSNENFRATEIPQLPELPKFPELPDLNFSENESLPKLPSFPSNSLGDKFSQNAIKEAVSGKKEVRGNADEFDLDEDDRMMQAPLREPLTLEERAPDRDEFPKGFERAARIVREAEPIFIRIDKFEESLNTFEKIKSKIHEIDKILNDTKRIKEEEDKALISWEKQLQTIKQQIDDIDRDIFSKVE